MHTAVAAVLSFTLASVALLHAPSAVHSAEVPGRTHSMTDSAGWQITLITGDRVQVTQRGSEPEAVTFLPARGRSDSALITYSGGHTFVVPSAARAGVAAGRLDRALFDVTTLIRQRYDDRRSATLPVIVQYSGSGTVASGRARSAQLRGVAKSRVLGSIGARAAAIQKSAASTFWDELATGKHGQLVTTIERVSLDDRVETALDRSVPEIGAPAAWRRGLTGRGVTIAVLDTGVDKSHPDLVGRVTSQNFTDAPDDGDHIGHGTHVASIAAGTGAASNGAYRGVAPDASILNAKVLDDAGSGYESTIIAGMEWAGALGADVANLSLGTSEPSDGTDPMSEALNRISRDSGTLFVVAAGNQGPKGWTVGSPGAADDALTIGSTARDGSLSSFSSRGPREGDGALKPELTAPGEEIVAARAAGTGMAEQINDQYTSLSGTSMATPHVAGVAALLAQAQPSWTAGPMKARLMSSADTHSGATVVEQGAGRVDADQATDGGVSVSSGELEFGMLRWPYPAPDPMLRWPYPASDPVIRELVYTNPGPNNVTLRVAASIEPPAAAPPRLSASVLAIPAGGSATVLVTADRAAAGPGTHTGRITATPSTGDPLVTTFGWHAEPESYDLTVRGINRDGNPTQADMVIGRPDGGPVPDDLLFGVPLSDGKAVVRLPRGHYDIGTVSVTDATDAAPDQWTSMSSGDLHLTKGTSVVLDARRGVPVDVSVEGRTDVNARQVTMTYARKDVSGRVSHAVGASMTGTRRQLFAVPTAKPAIGSAEFSFGARLEEPPFKVRLADGSAVPVSDFYFGPRFTGEKNLKVVDAGTAESAELTDVRGKLALIRRTAETAPGDQAHAAQRAGAAAVLFYDPDTAGPNGVFGYWVYAGDDLGVTVPAMRTSRVVAADLLQRLRSGSVTATVVGVAATPYSYDILVPWDRVPLDATEQLRQSDFATVDESIGAHRQDTPTSETRHGRSPGGGRVGGWMPPLVATPYHRTSYVLANGTSWSGLVVMDNGGESIGFRATERRYRAGERTRMRWLTPVMNSTVPAAEVIAGQGVRRVDGGLAVNFFPFGHGPDMFDGGYDAAGTFLLAVERDGEMLGSETSPSLRLDGKAAAGDYRVSLKAERDTPAWRYSTSIRSVWEFRSGGAEDEVMPLILADIDVPDADLLNQVRTGRDSAIRLSLRHLTGSQASAITSASVKISYDGATWTSLPVRRTGATSFTASVTHPATSAGTAPALKIIATDAAGGRLEQEISRAYGLIR